jgi:hypothetical protein
LKTPEQVFVKPRELVERGIQKFKINNPISHSTLATLLTKNEFTSPGVLSTVLSQQFAPANCYNSETRTKIADPSYETCSTCPLVGSCYISPFANLDLEINRLRDETDTSLTLRAMKMAGTYTSRELQKATGLLPGTINMVTSTANCDESDIPGLHQIREPSGDLCLRSISGEQEKCTHLNNCPIYRTRKV